ncbi:MFS transporter [Devosia sp.]|uniref:MFS transporter n=1 Tax=Devosia sp. TaxID=1871048 RepID=UPI003BA931DB
MPRMRLRDHASFQRFLASRVLSSMAFQGTGIAIGWLVYDRTHNAFDLGLIGLVQFLPMLVLTFVVGHVADQFDRRRIGLICQIVEASVVAIIALGVWQGWLSTPGIFVAVAVLGAAQAFERPTMAALLPGLMPSSMLQSAIAISTSFMQAAFIAGPTMGGLLYGVHPVAPFAAAAMMFLVASLCVSSIAKAERVPVRSKPTLSSVFAGIAFIHSKPVLLGTISLDLFAVLLGGATALLPMFARDILHAGPWALGLLRAAPAVGAVTMSLVLARFPLRHNVGKTMLGAVALFGVATLVFSLSSNIALSIAALVTLGAADTVSVVIRSSLVQLLTPDEMRGRVNAVNSLFIGTSNQLGEFESGMAAALLGPVGAGVFGAVGTLVIVALWAGLFPSLRKVDTLEG